MSTIKLAIGRENSVNVPDLFGNTVRIGMRPDGAVIFSVDGDGKNSDNSDHLLKQDVVIALSSVQTKALAEELLRLQP